MANQEYDNTNRGALFINNRKDRDSHPDYTGTLNVNGEEFWISGWKKQGRSGTFLSISVKPKEVKDGFMDQKPTGSAGAPASPSAPPPGGGGDDFEDDIPF